MLTVMVLPKKEMVMEPGMVSVSIAQVIVDSNFLVGRSCSSQ